MKMWTEEKDEIKLMRFNAHINKVCVFLLPVSLFAYLLANIISLSTIMALQTCKHRFYGTRIAYTA